MSQSRVLIAHQSTIPHYRVGFYEAVERRRPRWWDFEVVYDAAESKRRRYLELDLDELGFPTVSTRGLLLRIRSTRLLLQAFPLRAWRYDLLVVGDEMKNLSYSLSHLWRLLGKPVARWGHGRDATARDARGFKRLSEQFKIRLSRSASGFFAYTAGVRDFLIEQGLRPERVFTLNNTIDIVARRADFLSERGRRERHRADAGAADGRLLLFVGRLTGAKRLGFLAETFASLRSRDPTYRLVIVGVGEADRLRRFSELGLEGEIEWRGGLPEEELAKLLVAADLHVYPGPIGLGPLQALCFDLPSVVVKSDLHKPEYEYLSDENAIICPADCTPHQYAEIIHSTLDAPRAVDERRRRAWPSIQHLTIDHMADRFIEGVSTLLAPGRRN